jgi:hypothetical protein
VTQEHVDLAAMGFVLAAVLATFYGLVWWGVTAAARSAEVDLAPDDTAFRRGAADAERGLRVTACPYDEPKLARRWRAGWLTWLDSEELI